MGYSVESEAYRVLVLKDCLRRLRVEQIVFDLDGTLIDTRKVFVSVIREAAGIFAQVSGCGLEDIVRMIDGAIMELRPTHGVRQTIMSTSVEQVARRLGVTGGEAERALAIAQSTYAQLPEVFPQAGELLDMCIQAGYSPYVATHAGREWSEWKIRGTGLPIDLERVACFSIEATKAAQWGWFFRQFGLDPRKILVVGDNRYEDCAGPLELGARAVWVTNGISRVYGASVSGGEEVFTRNAERFRTVGQIGQVYNCLTGWI